MRKNPTPKSQVPSPNLGFTLIELLVVLSIMGLLLTLITVDLNGQRANRNLVIAQNELVTNLKGLQSYTLSSRNINGSQPVQYYIAKFDRTYPDQYTLQAIYNAASAPVLRDIQTVKFPSGVKLSDIFITPAGSANAKIPTGCALVAFRLPFAKIIMNNGCSHPTDATPWDPADDYQKILNFAQNSGESPYGDSNMEINIVYSQSALAKKVTIKGMAGTILFQ